ACGRVGGGLTHVMTRISNVRALHALTHRETSVNSTVQPTAAISESRPTRDGMSRFYKSKGKTRRGHALVSLPFCNNSCYRETGGHMLAREQRAVRTTAHQGEDSSMRVKSNSALRAGARPIGAKTTVAAAVAGVLWGAGGVAWAQAVSQ